MLAICSSTHKKIQIFLVCTSFSTYKNVLLTAFSNMMQPSLHTCSKYNPLREREIRNHSPSLKGSLILLYIAKSFAKGVYFIRTFWYNGVVLNGMV